MTTYIENRVENIGATEQVVRGSVGMASILVVLLMPSLSSTLIAVLSFGAIYTVLTAIMTWDPIYALVRKSQHRDEAATASVTSYTSRPQTSGSHDFKKAA